MRQRFVLASILICLISACSKQKNDQQDRKFISMQLDSLIILAENPTATLTPANLSDNDPNNDFPALTITAAGNSDETIKFNLVSETYPFKAGTYLSTQQGNGLAVTFNDSIYTLLADNNNGYLALTITNVEDSLIEGDFSGLLADTSNTFGLKPVTHGAFRAVIKSN